MKRLESSKLHPRGAILIAVFWIMAIMGLALVATMRISKYQTTVAASQLNGIEARQYAEMGIAVAANPQVEKWDYLLQQSFQNGSGFKATIKSEGGRFNINYIVMSDDKPLLRLIFAEWGIEFEIASEIADALVDWVDSNDETQLNGAEFEYYEGQGYLNRPFNRPFYDLEEVRLVRGWQTVEAANPSWREWFTIWSSGGLDVTEAPAEFLAIAADGNLEDAYQVVQIVDGPDGIRNTEDDQPLSVDEAMPMLGVLPDEIPFRRYRFNTDDQVTRIESIGFSGPFRRKIVLIIRDRNRNPTILDRYEENLQ